MSDTPRTDAAYAASTGAGIYELFKESQDIERELNSANESFRKLNIHALNLVDRIKRMEEVGDEAICPLEYAARVRIWRKAKEDKP